MQVCFVSGVHRSGTSTIAAMLDYMGVALGKASIQASDKDNARGYYENLDIVRFNDSILTDIGLRWDSLLVSNAAVSTYAEERKARAEELLKANFTAAERCYVKDPRLAFFVDFWAEMFPAVFDNVEPAHVFVLRHPKGVVASLKRRSDAGVVPFHYAADRELSHLFWIANTIGFIDRLAGKPCLVIGYGQQNTPDDRKALFRQITTFLGMDYEESRLEAFDRDFFDTTIRARHELSAKTGPLGPIEEDAGEIHRLIAGLQPENTEPTAADFATIAGAPVIAKYRSLLSILGAVYDEECRDQMTDYRRIKPQEETYLSLNRSADLIWGQAGARGLAAILRDLGR